MKVEAAVKQELFTLVNLTKEHLKDRDKEKCNCKREFVKPEKAPKIAEELDACGHYRASEFVVKNARFMVTFAQLD